MGVVPSLGWGEAYGSAVCIYVKMKKIFKFWQSQAPQDCIRGKEFFWVSGSQCGIWMRTSITWESLLEM